MASDAIGDYQKQLHAVVQKVGIYPLDAYLFVQQGLQTAVERIHARTATDESHHVTGEQLCHGLREVATERWGFLARTVLHTWGIRRTLDFGRIVYAMIDAGLFSKTDEDSIEDFRDVYDFATAFETEYRIGSLT
jgi:uncharacterized repeat protein (TIGR04138 family)